MCAAEFLAEFSLGTRDRISALLGRANAVAAGSGDSDSGSESFSSWNDEADDPVDSDSPVPDLLPPTPSSAGRLQNQHRRTAQPLAMALAQSALFLAAKSASEDAAVVGYAAAAPPQPAAVAPAHAVQTGGSRWAPRQDADRGHSTEDGAGAAAVRLISDAAKSRAKLPAGARAAPTRPSRRIRPAQPTSVGFAAESSSAQPPQADTPAAAAISPPPHGSPGTPGVAHRLARTPQTTSPVMASLHEAIAAARSSLADCETKAGPVASWQAAEVAEVAAPDPPSAIAAAVAGSLLFRRQAERQLSPNDDSEEWQLRGASLAQSLEQQLDSESTEGASDIDSSGSDGYDDDAAEIESLWREAAAVSLSPLGEEEAGGSAAEGMAADDSDVEELLSIQIGEQSSSDAESVGSSQASSPPPSRLAAQFAAAAAGEDMERPEADGPAAAAAAAAAGGKKGSASRKRSPANKENREYSPRQFDAKSWSGPSNPCLFTAFS